MRLVARALARYALPVLAAALLVADLVACWVIPWRLRYGEHGSYYAFGYIGDEYTYAERIQPLLAGSTRGNTINGVTDSRYISIYYLEDLLRSVLTVLHLDVVRFVWAYRILFPMGLMASLYLLVGVCVPSHGRTWGRSVRLAMTAALFPLIFWGYEEVTTFPPVGGWINRFPTGCEYILAILLAWAFLRFLERKTAARGVVLALFGAALVYLRPYAAIAWGPAIALPMLVLFATRAMPLRTSLATLAVLVAALTPWYAIKKWDEKLPVYDDIFHRYLDQPSPGTLHDQWKLYMGFGAALFFVAWRAQRWWRPFALGTGAALVLLPLNCHWFPMAKELLAFDRFGVLYLVAAAAAIALWIGQRTIAWKSHHAALWSVALLACGAWACRSTYKLNAGYDFLEYPLGPLRAVVPDLNRVPAYRWIREHTRPDALFLVELPSRSAFDKVDLFGTVARRRRVFEWRLNGEAIPQEKFDAAKRLYQATVGDWTMSPADYARKWVEWSPEYVLWRKDRPIPRGSGNLLLPFREVVYADEACEIWKVRPLDVDELAFGVH